ncbi:TPA: hypothetical protein PCI30_000815 [Klebsiella pneumoniae]|nr:hypothetical protein [Klebsiella pneumoniae]
MTITLALQLLSMLKCITKARPDAGRVLAHKLIAHHVFMYSGFCLRFTAFLSHN